jgi:hypothetical protein
VIFDKQFWCRDCFGADGGLDIALFLGGKEVGDCFEEGGGFVRYLQ